MMYRKLQLLLVVLVYSVAVESICKTTFITTCESVYDVLDYGHQTWKNLIISNDLCGNEENATSLEPPQHTLEHRMFSECSNLEELYIIRQLNNIHPSAFDGLEHLAYLKLYKNDIGVIPTGTFSNLSQLFKLDLNDNSIEKIQLINLNLDNIHWVLLSHNKLNIIQTDQFIIPNLKKLTVSYNNIVTLVPKCFHKNLEYIDLDHNKLQFIANGVFDHMQNLKVLILSNNKLDGIVITFMLANLEKLDLSHNSIAGISDASFAKFPKLEYLNLGHNLLKYLSPKIFATKTKIRVLKLDNNLLINLDGEFQSKLTALQEISIGANPWICACLTEISRIMKEMNIQQTDCDRNYFANGQFPVCSLPEKIGDKCTGNENLTELIYGNFRTLMTNYDC